MRRIPGNVPFGLRCLNRESSAQNGKLTTALELQYLTLYVYKVVHVASVWQCSKVW